MTVEKISELKEKTDEERDKVVAMNSRVTDINYANEVIEKCKGRFAHILVVGLDKDDQMSVLATNQSQYQNIAYMEVAKTFLTSQLLFGNQDEDEE